MAQRTGYPSLYLNPMGSPEPACAVRGELVKNLKAGRDSMSTYDLWWMQR